MADTGTFSLTAYRANGSGVADAQVRVLNANHVDVTSTLFGSASGRTDQTGNVTKYLTSTDRLQFGQTYIIQVIAPGFDLWSESTSTAFNGDGTFTANLVRNGEVVGDYTLTGTASDHMSSMTPILCQMASDNTGLDWEYIRTKVERPNGKSSTIETPVDKTTHQAIIDIRSRLGLGIKPLLVGDADKYRDDTEFSTKVAVTFSTLSSEGESQLPDSFEVFAAATLPPDRQNNLNAYANRTNQRWLVPSEPVIAFRGYYRDVSIWLSYAEASGYLLIRQYLDAAGNVIDTLSESINSSDYVQRVKLNTDPIDGVVSCLMSVQLNGQAITKPLTILYRD